MMLRALVRPLRDIDCRTEGAWSDLAARAAEPNPFFEPIVVRALARHHGYQVALLTVERASDIVLCLPLLTGTLGWNGLRLPAWTSWFNPLSTPLVDPTDSEAIFACAVTHLASLSGPRLLKLELLATDGPVAAALDAATARRRPPWCRVPEFTRSTTRPTIRRRDDGAYFATTLQGGRKRKLAQLRRNLERLLGERLRVIDEAGNAEAVERLMAIEVRGWKGRVGSAVACKPERVNYFREVCAGFSAQGRLQLLSLQGAGKTLAMRCNIRSGGMAFALRSAYEERFAKGSPGSQFEIEAVSAFHASGDVMIDSCANYTKAPYFSLWPDIRTLSRFVVTLDRMVEHQR